MRAVAPIVAVLVLSLAGCAATPDPTVTDGGHRLIVATGVPSTMAGVGFGGKVGIDQAGCVVLGGDRVLLAPPGSVLKNTKVTLTFGANQRVTVTIGETTDQLGGTEVGPGSPYVPTGTKCSSTKFLLLG